jgi:ethanolamine transporter EutH
MRKIVLKFGLIAGAIMAAIMSVSFRFEDEVSFDSGLIIGYSSMVLAFLMVFFGVKAYRDKVAAGRISFGKGLQVGLLITLLATACYVATWEVIYFKFAPDFMEKYSARQISESRKHGATEAQLAERSKQAAVFAENYKKPLYNIALTSLEPLPVGVVFALVTAGMLSRKKREW